MKLGLRLTLLSDATFGRGDGVAGLVDQEIEHDGDTGLPIIRGRTLKGLLVEECANLLYALERGAPVWQARYQSAAQAMFGAPGSAVDEGGSLRFGPAMLPAVLRDAVRRDIQRKRFTRDDVIASLTAIRRQTAVDDATDAPEQDSLRSMRVLMRGLSLTATLEFVEPPNDDYLALLAACVKALRHAGIGRNRGRGEIRASLQAYTDDQTPALDVTDEYFVLFLAKDTPSYLIEYDVHLLEPALVTALEGDPNSAVASAFIPGSVLRGMLIQRYMSAGRSNPATLLGDRIAKRLFFDTRTRFLNGYLLEARGEQLQADQRSLPAPLSWRQNKQEVRQLDPERDVIPTRDLASTPLGEHEFGDDWKSVGDDAFTVQLEPGLYRRTKPDVTLAVHTMRQRDFGRARADAGAVYRYESLAAAQTFRAYVLCEDASMARSLQLLLNGECLIGGARTAGYGRAQLRGAPVRDATYTSTWRETGDTPPALAAISANAQFTVTLLSDALLRDANGTYAMDARVLAGYVERGLGLSPGTLQIDAERVFVNTRAVGGFNRTWGLPLLQATAIRMGSVVAFTTTTEIPRDVVLKLEREGVGERRIEGYGRVAVNWSWQGCARLAFQPKETPPPPSSPVALSQSDGATQAQALQMALRLLRARLDSKLIDRTLQLAEEVAAHAAISPSQLSRLRMIVRDELSQVDALWAHHASALTHIPPKPHPLRADIARLYWQGRKRILDYGRSLDARRSTREQFDRVRLSNRLEKPVPVAQLSLHRWIAVHVRQPCGIWLELDVGERLDLPASDVGRPGIGDLAAPATLLLAYEYTLRLIHATLRLAAKDIRK